MKNIIKKIGKNFIITLALFTSVAITAQEQVKRMIHELKAQEAITSTSIAQWPVLTSIASTNNPDVKNLQTAVEQDIKNIKNDLEKINKAIILLIKKQQEILVLMDK
jgi:hypothetical protein